MNIFVIYYRDDYDQVIDKIKRLKNNGRSAKFIMHQASDQKWRHLVKRDIRDCNCVLMFAGAKTWNSPKVAWEIRVAKKYKKTIYVIRIDNHVPIHQQLFRRIHVRCPKSDRRKSDLIFQQQKNLSYRYDMTLEKFNEKLAKYENHDFGVFRDTSNGRNPLSSDEMKALLEQYTMFVKTSEDLVQRRQTVNSFYITINSALLAFSSALFGIEVDINVRIGLMLALCFTGIMTSISWRRMLISYGQLNRGKMRVIAELEKYLPASLFDAEWAAVKNPMNGYEHKSYTEREKSVPWIFIFAYVFALLILLAYAVFLHSTSAEMIPETSCVVAYILFSQM